VQLVHEDNSRESVNACTLEIHDDITIEIPEISMLSSHVITKAPASFPQTFFEKLVERTDSDCSHGIAVDLGTTTIAVYLCDIAKGEVIGSIAVKNPQALYGDDVMSRIAAINLQQESLKHLQQIVVNGIEWGVKALLQKAGLSQEQLGRMVVVGNPTMIHILTGVNPAPIGTSPYLPAFHEARTTRAADAGFHLGDMPLMTLPQVSGFIGGDILAAALAVDMEQQPEGTLLIDLGTNGELLFKGNSGLYATSCATGPAFEGATLSCGMQAIPGAVNKVTIGSASDFPGYTIITNNGTQQPKPCGVCGTGVLSGVAELCRHSIVATSGAFTKGDTISPLVRDEDNKLKYILIPAEASQDGATVHISQKDIRSVQLGKAALITGIEFLLQAAGYDHPEKIIIAGAFGNYIDIRDMFTLGMIPAMTDDKVETVGNSAGAGAVMVLCDESYREKAIAMAAGITTVELAGNLKFQQVFVEKLSFPTMKN
jgi:uncharacterized 2Fe-2S/4Fe-4S cluster protein (DUF4445 family)